MGSADVPEQTGLWAGGVCSRQYSKTVHVSGAAHHHCRAFQQLQARSRCWDDPSHETQGHSSREAPRRQDSDPAVQGHKARRLQSQPLNQSTATLKLGSIFRKHPRKASILNMPLVTTLFYSCFYHYTEAEVQAQCERKIPHTLTAREELSLKPVFRCTL